MENKLFRNVIKRTLAMFINIVIIFLLCFVMFGGCAVGDPNLPSYYWWIYGICFLISIPIMANAEKLTQWFDKIMEESGE